MTRRNIEDTHELLDPSLSALLREAYTDDPALTPAPGRTERIMRVVKSTGRRGVHMIWASFAWGVGATATAAIIIALMLGLGQPRDGDRSNSSIADANAGTHQVTPANKKQEQSPLQNWQNEIASKGANTLAPPPHEEYRKPDIGKVHEQSPNGWNEEPQVTKKDTPTEPTRQETPKDNTPATGRDEVVVAAALYNVGTTAYHYGDYETAYAAFQDSYETMPTPEAALSTGDALERMAQKTLADGSSDI